MIELKNISKVYKSKRGLKTEALKDVSIKFDDKGLVFILGKSGCGKSTLLNIIGGLDKYDSGDLLINGKSTNKFKEKEFDAYRNTFIGFVFQDFNLLENYSIYKNISLSLELQNKKIDKTKINEILKIVGLENFGNRKPNELSGGQKQRIAIARALIKNPNVILADEPTGNLDSVTGRQIFELLKKLSKEKLVIVVSHDEEFAQRYADRIIELKDGIVIKDTKKVNDLKNSKTFKLINAKLPFKYTLKMGLKNLFHKKIKLFLTLLLTTFSLICLGLLMSATSFDLNKEHISTLIENNEYEIIVKKYSKVIDNEEITKMSFSTDLSLYENIYGENLEITDEMIMEAQNKTGVKWHKQLTIVQDSKTASFEFASNNSEQTLYYQSVLPITFVELNNKEFISNLIGTFPINSDEIVISNYIADNIIQNGIYLKKENGKELEIYKPKSYSQIISEGKYIQISGLNNAFKIVGIIENDLNEISPLKNVTFDDYAYSWDYTSLYQILMSNTENYSRVYVNEDFISNLDLKENNMSYNTSKIYVDNKYYVVSQIGYILNEIEAFDGIDLIKFNTLADNEIIIDINVLNDVTNGDYQKKLEEYYKENLYIENLSIEKFTKDYIQKNNIINSKIKTNVTKDKITRDIDNYEEYIIKGVILKENYSSTIYYSKDKINKLVTKNLFASNMFTVASNEEELIKCLNTYPIDKSDVLATTKYSDGILECTAFVYLIRLVGKYGSIFFLMFSMALLINFISTSINYRKKEIGILRALGCKSKDVLKMFIVESLVLVTICLIFADIGINKIVFLFNDVISTFVSNDIKFLVYGNEQKILLITITFAIIIVANLFPIRKITKMKPIDAILNK